MNHRTRLLAAALLALASAGSLSQSATPSIEVRGSNVRTDVQALCAGIHDELPAALARVARERSEPALIEVLFALDGRSVGEVQTSGGPPAYQRAVRRAVRDLQCASPDPGRQTPKLRIRFIDPFAAKDRRAVALVTDDQAP